MEPLIFVEVALVRGLADNVQALLDESQPVGDPQSADTAIFYSISNAQKGLAGISFGNFLIKRVVEKLSRELPNIKHFATLSPVPGFSAWLHPKLEKGDVVLLPNEAKAIAQVSKNANAVAGMKMLLAGDWATHAEAAEALKAPLMRLCAVYLAQEKKRDKALDPVAHFHLTNGAVLERINWLGDRSPKGFKQSAGMMVNYYYKLDDINENHETYVSGGEIKTSKAVKALLKA